MIKFFLQQGANVNAINDDGEYVLDFNIHLRCILKLYRTPLHVAVAQASDYNVSRLLIESGADLGNRSIDGKTPLHIFFNEVVKRIILCHRENIEDEIRDNEGMTLLHFLTWSSKSRPEHLELYIGKGRSSFMARDYYGRSILHLAAYRGNTLVLDYLFRFRNEIDVMPKDDRGRTLLHYAVESRRIETIDMMVRLKLDIREADHEGRTILHLAAMCDNLAAVERVIELGGEKDLQVTDNDGRTPLQLARVFGATTVTRYLDERRAHSRKNQGRAEESLPTYNGWGRYTAARRDEHTRDPYHAFKQPFLQAKFGFKNSSFFYLLMLVLLWYFWLYYEHH